MLMRVFDNVFSNIRKYGDKHIVTVSLQVEKGNVLIRLKNRRKRTHPGRKAPRLV